MVPSRPSTMVLLGTVGLMLVATVEAMNMELKSITHLDMNLWNESLGNARLMDMWAKCMANEGPCDMISSPMKAMISDNGPSLDICEGCNMDQRIKMAMFFKKLKSTYPVQYNRMINQYRNKKSPQTVARTRTSGTQRLQLRVRPLQAVSYKQLDELLTNQKKVESWALCAMSQGPCDPLGSTIKDVLSSWDVMGEVCPHCTKAEKRKLSIILQTLKTIYPDYYARIIEHFTDARRF